MKTLLIAGMLMVGLLFTQNVNAQDCGRHFPNKSPNRIHRQAETVKMFDVGNAVKNSLQRTKFCVEQTVDGVVMILRAPFTVHPERLPLFREYRYYRPLYIPSRWERVN